MTGEHRASPPLGAWARTPTTHHSPPTVFSFGERACRLFRLLVRKRARGPPRYSRSGNLKLELKQLTRMSLMPDREARPLLLKLFQAGLLMLQEVPRSTDRVPKGTTYLWHVDSQQVAPPGRNTFTVQPRGAKLLVTVARRRAVPCNATSCAASTTWKRALRLRRPLSRGYGESITTLRRRRGSASLCSSSSPACARSRVPSSGCTGH